MNILIIEDETPTALQLQRALLKTDPGIRVLGIEDSIETAVEWLRAHAAPDLIFMDIQLADGQSFEIFDEVNITSPVVFCTAFDEHALRAFQANGIEYILKPFDEAAIARALGKARSLESFYHKTVAATAGQLLKPADGQFKTSFLVSQRDKMVPVAVRDISFFYIEDEVVFLQTTEGRRHMVNHSLDELERMVSPAQFFRANRQVIINFEEITAIESYFARKTLVKTRSPLKFQVVVSKEKSSEFVRWVENR